METIEDLLIGWGEWRNRALRARPIRGAAMYTPGAIETRGTYKTRCHLCLGRKIDPGRVGSRIVRQSDDDYEALVKHYPCPACRGRGYTSESAMKADPGAIRRTGPGGMHVPVDETPSDIAQLEEQMNLLSFTCRAVLTARYVAVPRVTTIPGASSRRARVAWVNQAISPEKLSEDQYNRRLWKSKQVLAEALNMPTKKQETWA